MWRKTTLENLKILTQVKKKSINQTITREKKMYIEDHQNKLTNNVKVTAEKKRKEKNYNSRNTNVSICLNEEKKK